MAQHANTIAGTANLEYRERMVCRATELVGGFDELTTRTRIYLVIDRRTGEPYRLSIELLAIAKCRRRAFEHSALTMAQERLSCTIDIQSCRTSIIVNRLLHSLSSCNFSNFDLKLYCKKYFSD